MLWWIGMTTGVSGMVWLATTPLVRKRGDAELVRRNIVGSSIIIAIGATLVSVGAPPTAPPWVSYVAVVALLLASAIVGRVGALSDEELVEIPGATEGDTTTPMRKRREPSRMELIEDRRRRQAAQANRNA